MSRRILIEEHQLGAHTHPLSEILQSGATTNQVPSWSGSAWVPVTLSSAGAGAGLSIGGSGDIQLGKEEPTDNTVQYIDLQEFPTLSDFVICSDYQSWWDTLANPYSLLQLASSSLKIETFDPTLTHSSTIEATSSPTDSSTLLQIYDGTNSSSISFRLINGMFVTDGINNKGLENTADYSANWTDHSLITKKWAEDTFGDTTPNALTITSTATQTINVDTNRWNNILLQSNAVINITTISNSNYFRVILRLKQDATGSRTVTWNSGGQAIIWKNGTAPSLAGSANWEDIVELFWDGTRINGLHHGSFG